MIPISQGLTSVVKSMDTLPHSLVACPRGRDGAGWQATTQDDYVEWVRKNYPAYRAYSDDGAVCEILRASCEAGRVVRYDFEPAYTTLHYLSMLAIPSGVVALMLAVLNLFYYRALLYVVFGRDIPPP